MNVIIKPFEERYSGQCSELLQYLWKESSEERLRHFEWEYLNNPNNDNVVMAVIAVNDDDEVIGFRGFHLLSAYFGDTKMKIAYIADTVVSPKARRQGIFQKMTEYSFSFLMGNGIYFIGDLGPSWPPYFGNKKLGFEDLSLFYRKFRFNVFSILSQMVLKDTRDEKSFSDTFVDKRVSYHVTSALSDDVLKQIPDNKEEKLICPCRDYDTLKWKSKHPGAHYVYAYSFDSKGQLLSFMWFKTRDSYRYILALYFSNDSGDLRKLYGFFNKIAKPSVVEVWTWALSSNSKMCVRALNFMKVPFLNIIKKNPPSLIRSLKKNSDGTIDWKIGGIDCRLAENWVVDKFEADSF